MPTCKEFYLDDLMAITAIPVTSYNPAAVPVASPSGVTSWQLTPTITIEDFAPSWNGAVTIGLKPDATGVPLIPIIRASGKAKDDEKDSVAGRLHTVSVSCQVDDRDLSSDTAVLTILDRLLQLERTPSHLFLTFRDNSCAFVQASKDTYLCTVDRDGAKTTVQFRIECLMGIQMLI